MGRLLVLSLWMALSIAEVAHWQSNRTLWARAVLVNTRQARPALNYAATFRDQTEAEDAIHWLVVAGDRLPQSPRAEELRTAIQQHLWFWEAMGLQVCGRTAVRRYC